MFFVRMFDRHMVPIGIEEDIVSLVWTERYSEPGKFQLILPLTPHNTQTYARMGVMVWIRGAKDAGIVENISVDEYKNELTLEGRFLTCMLSWRFVREEIDYDGNKRIEVVMRTLFNESRAIPLVELGQLRGWTEVVDDYFLKYGSDLGKSVKSLAKAGNLGYRLTPDFKNKRITFDVLHGVDRTNGANGPKVTFSQKNGDFSELSFLDNDQMKVDKVVGSGEFTYYLEPLEKGHYEGPTSWTFPVVVGWTIGTGASRITHDVYYNTGLKERSQEPDYSDLREKVSKATHMRLTSLQRGTQSREYTLDEYQTSYTLGTDFDVGDIVKCRAEVYGTEDLRRVVETQRVWDRKGARTVITLGELKDAQVDWSSVSRR